MQTLSISIKLAAQRNEIQMKYEANTQREGERVGRTFIQQQVNKSGECALRGLECCFARVALNNGTVD